MARPKIVYGATGSVASIKFWKLLKKLQEFADVKAVFTDKGEFFANKARTHNGSELRPFFYELNWEQNKRLTDCIIFEQDEWSWDKIGDPIPHIDLRDWADIMVIAPLSANTMAKMANGICDNLLTSIYRAWPLLEKPIVVAPAMNTQMWKHPITREHLDKLRSFQFMYHGMKNHVDFFRVIQPVESNLACGTKGIGAMASLDRIVEVVKEFTKTVKEA